MIDKAYWEKIADQWKKQDEGIDIPTIDTGGAGAIDPTIDSFGDVLDETIDDILSDIDFDEI